MIKMKKFLAILLIVVITFAFAACGGSTNEETSGGEIITGGWEKAESPVITDELAELFNKAMEDLVGADYVPVAFVAKQIVSGTNYMFLVRTAPVIPDPVETYALVTIYEDLEGNVEILDIYNSNIETNINGLMGGWQATETPELTEEVEAAFVTNYEPVAIAATQVVSGTNYCVLCQQPGTIDPATSYVMAYLYIDLQGNAEITDAVDFMAA